MDEKNRPEDDVENLLQQASDRYSIEQAVLAPQTFVAEYLQTHPPHLEQAGIQEVTFDPVDQGLTQVTFHLRSHPEGAMEKLASLGGFDFRAVRGELERWKSACQEAYGGVGPLAESEKLRKVLRPPG
jgi:hypothetical protein